MKKKVLSIVAICSIFASVLAPSYSVWAAPKSHTYQTIKNGKIINQKKTRRFPLGTIVLIGGIAYVVYKNLTDCNFSSAVNFAKSEAVAQMIKPVCIPGTDQCAILEPEYAKVWGFIKGFASAETCILTDGHVCYVPISFKAAKILTKGASTVKEFIDLFK